MNTKIHNPYGLYFAGCFALVVTLALITYPEAAFEASLEGLRLWLEVVVPAILPFLIMAEILIGLGVVHFIGTLLEPIMQPIFRIPGVGAFAVALGLASGFPIGAKISGQLRRNQLCTQVEGERLVCFSNTAGPLFMAGAVAVGMFGMPEIAVTLMAAHYLSVICVGFLMRFHKGDESPRQQHTAGNIGSRALKSMHDARYKDGRHFGKMFGDAISGAFSSIFFIGGCIVMFAILIRLLEISGFITAIANLIGSVLMFTGLNTSTIAAFITGIFEIDIGAHAISQTQAPLIQKITLTSAIIAWSGLSVHAQVAAMIQGTDIRIKPYIIARIIHAALAGIFAALLFNPIQNIMANLNISIPVLKQTAVTYPTFLGVFMISTQIAILVLALLLMLGIGAVLFRRIIVFYSK